MASIHFMCPVCRQSLKVSATLAGRKGRCPFCSAKVRIPVNDHGTAEVLDTAVKQGGSDVAAAPAEAADPGRGLKGAGDMLPSIVAGIHADDGIPSMAPRGAAGGSPSSGDLQSQLDRQLGDAAPEHGHRTDAATLKYNQTTPPPVIEPEDGDKTKLPGEGISLPRPANTANVANAADLSSTDAAENSIPPRAADDDLPTAARGATVKYAPEHNPVRASAELHNLSTRREQPSPPVSLAIPPPGHDSAPAAAMPTITPSDLPKVASAGLPAASGRMATPGEPLPAAARTAALDELLQVNSDNQVGDVLASLPRERPQPTSAVANLGSPHPVALGAPAQEPVTAVQNATMQTPAAPAASPAAAQAGGSLVGDKCDPSRAGLSAAPLIAWVSLVILTIGGLTAWLVVDGLARRGATIRSSQAFLRVSDLAVAQREYFAQPVAAQAGGEYAVSLGLLQERGLLNGALWNEGVAVTVPATAEAAAPGVLDGPRELAQGNGYRYVLWFKRQTGVETPAIVYVDGGRVTRGFAVAAVPTDAANWAYAIDERGRMIQWRHTPLPPDAPAGMRPGDPVQAGAYPADSDFDKLPIR